MYFNYHPNYDCDVCGQNANYSSYPMSYGIDDERQLSQLFPSMGLPNLFPPIGPQGQGPQFGPTPPGFFPPYEQSGGGQQSGPPTSPPPSFVPTQQPQAFAVDPGGIARCMFRFTYVWLNNGQQFWFFPIFVGRRSISGYRWNGFRWLYFGIDLRQIQSFTCG